MYCRICYAIYIKMDCGTVRAVKWSWIKLTATQQQWWWSWWPSDKSKPASALALR